MKHLLISAFIMFPFSVQLIKAQGLNLQGSDTISNAEEKEVVNNKSKFIIGGYGEIAMTRNFYSDEWQRYMC